jgi:hypothetical protein
MRAHAAAPPKLAQPNISGSNTTSGSSRAASASTPEQRQLHTRQPAVLLHPPVRLPRARSFLCPRGKRGARREAGEERTASEMKPRAAGFAAAQTRFAVTQQDSATSSQAEREGRRPAGPRQSGRDAARRGWARAAVRRRLPSSQAWEGFTRKAWEGSHQ